MKKTLICLALVAALLFFSIISTNAQATFPPQGSEEVAADTSFAAILQSSRARNVLLVDQFGILYYLTVGGGQIIGVADGPYTCDYGGEYPVSGSYTGLHYTFTVTTPIPCDNQYYVVDGTASLATRTGVGTYDWNGDGVDGDLILTFSGIW